MITPIHYTKPSITELEIRYATDAATVGWGERCYEYIGRFERDFTARIGAKHGIATSSATGALHMGLSALGVGRGDEVIMADINWIATASPIVHLGAKPIFIDVIPGSWCLDPDKLLQAITPKTKVIIATHLYGNLCAMDVLLEIGRSRGIPVVEDAAEAIGSVDRGRHAGTMGIFGIFSFHGTKTITTGEGGMFVTSDTGLYEQVLTLANHGRARGETRQFWPERVGFKYKMSNVQAAIGCAQVERWNEIVERKREIFAWYWQELADLPVRMNPEPAGTQNGFWMPTIVVDDDVAFDRSILLAAFKAAQIDGRVFFWPLSSLPMFDPCPNNMIGRHLSARAVNLPSYHDLTRADVERVSAVVRDVLTRAATPELSEL